MNTRCCRRVPVSDEMYIRTVARFLLVLILLSFLVASTEARRKVRRNGWGVRKRQHKKHTTPSHFLNRRLPFHGNENLDRNSKANGFSQLIRNVSNRNGNIFFRHSSSNKKIPRNRKFPSNHNIHRNRKIPSSQNDQMNRFVQSHQQRKNSHFSSPTNSRGSGRIHIKMFKHGKHKLTRAKQNRKPQAAQENPNLSDKEKRMVVKMHNKARTTTNPSAEDMLVMTWDENLAVLALSHAKKCSWEHSQKTTRRNKYGYKYIGENLYASTERDVPSGIQSWADEIDFYNYWKSTCIPGKMCYHFTQMVWAKTTKVGCAVAFCPRIRIWNQNNVFYLVCNYGPGGNIVGRKPYTEGRPCQSCPRDRYCVKHKLCKRIKC